MGYMLNHMSDNGMKRSNDESPIEIKPYYFGRFLYTPCHERKENQYPRMTVGFGIRGMIRNKNRFL